MRSASDTWQGSELTDVTAKVIIHETFVEDKLPSARLVEVSRSGLRPLRSPDIADSIASKGELPSSVPKFHPHSLRTLRGTRQRFFPAHPQPCVGLFSAG